MRRRQFVTGIGLATLGWRTAHATAAPPFVMASVVSDSESFASRWLNLIYHDAFNQLGVPLLIRYFPAARATAEAAAGNVDGELVRDFGYQQMQPTLLRVPEPTFIANTTAYASHGGVTLAPGWEGLRNTPYRVEFRLGYAVMARKLAAVVPADKLGTVRNAETGLRKLSLGRIDLYVDNAESVDALLAQPEFRGAGIHPVAVLEHSPVHAYLNRRHAALLAPLAAILKQMRASGQIERYRLQALHQK